MDGMGKPYLKEGKMRLRFWWGIEAKRPNVVLEFVVLCSPLLVVAHQNSKTKILMTSIIECEVTFTFPSVMPFWSMIL